MTKSEIRAEILGRAGVKKVTIKRDGTIIVRGDMPRGDGGPTPWSMYVGQADEYPWNQ